MVEPAARCQRMSTPLHTFLRAHRIARRLTLQAVAVEIGVRQNTLSQWETGARGVDLTDLEKLARVYGVTPAALLMSPLDSPKAREMQAAADLAQRMEPADLANWMQLGQRLARDKAA